MAIIILDILYISGVCGKMALLEAVLGFYQHKISEFYFNKSFDRKVL